MNPIFTYDLVLKGTAAKTWLMAEEMSRAEDKKENTIYLRELRIAWYIHRKVTSSTKCVLYNCQRRRPEGYTIKWIRIIAFLARLFVWRLGKKRIFYTIRMFHISLLIKKTTFLLKVLGPNKTVTSSHRSLCGDVVSHGLCATRAVDQWRSLFRVKYTSQC